MEQIYLVLDSNGIPIAQAVLESPANADVMQLRILQGSADTVTARRDVQLIGMDDRAQARRGLVIRQRGDQVVIQPTAALGAEARENLRIQTDFESVINRPVEGLPQGGGKGPELRRRGLLHRGQPYREGGGGAGASGDG